MERPIFVIKIVRLVATRPRAQPTGPLQQLGDAVP